MPFRFVVGGCRSFTHEWRVIVEDNTIATGKLEISLDIGEITVTIVP